MFSLYFAYRISHIAYHNPYEIQKEKKICKYRADKEFSFLIFCFHWCCTVVQWCSGTVSCWTMYTLEYGIIKSNVVVFFLLFFHFSFFSRWHIDLRLNLSLQCDVSSSFCVLTVQYLLLIHSTFEIILLFFSVATKCAFYK